MYLRTIDMIFKRETLVHMYMYVSRIYVAPAICQHALSTQQNDLYLHI